MSDFSDTVAVILSGALFLVAIEGAEAMLKSAVLMIESMLLVTDTFFQALGATTESASAGDPLGSIAPLLMITAGVAVFKGLVDWTMSTQQTISQAETVLDHVDDSDDADRDDQEDEPADADRDESDDAEELDVDELEDVDELRDAFASGEIPLYVFEREIESELESEMPRDPLIEPAVDDAPEDSDDVQEDSDAESDTSRERERAIGPVKKPDIGGIERDESDS